MKMKVSILNSLIILVLILLGCATEPAQEPPNILWITSEDNSPFLGCYGDDFATTPNFDKMASKGFRYTHAYANAPVCAPARNTIISGVYANSNGSQHMRSYYKKSDKVPLYPVLLRQAGYYCTNNSKEDYNFQQDETKNIWDESSRKAHYKNRQPGQPFFAIFNLTVSHESSIHKSIPTDQLRHDPQKVTLPPYHPDTEDMRHDWAQYYDKIEDLDTQVGELLEELEREGLADNTIVFYYGDHGGVIARSKRYVYESGTHVPFIVHIPEKYKNLFPTQEPGMVVDRLISFVDLAPTLLSLAEIPIPEVMQGHAFLGGEKTSDPEYAYMFRGRMDERFDMSRAIRDQKFRYIHNYIPYRIYGQHLNYLWKAPSIRSWEQAYLEGKCDSIQSVFWNAKPPEELYDTENDPWEVNNLANDPAFKDQLVKMREAANAWEKDIFDAGFIPEAMLTDLAGDMSFYDYMRSGEVDMEALIAAADLATLGGEDHLQDYVKMLENEVGAIRYWGATGLLILKDKARPAMKDMMSALDDPAPDVVAVLAEALYGLGEKEPAKKALLSVLESPNGFARTRALNIIDVIDEKSPEIVAGVIGLLKGQKEIDLRAYDVRSCIWLLEKWQIDPEKYGLKLK